MVSTISIASTIAHMTESNTEATRYGVLVTISLPTRSIVDERVRVVDERVLVVDERMRVVDERVWIIDEGVVVCRAREREVIVNF